MLIHFIHPGFNICLPNLYFGPHSSIALPDRFHPSSGFTPAYIIIIRNLFPLISFVSYSITFLCSCQDLQLRYPHVAWLAVGPFISCLNCAHQRTRLSTHSGMPSQSSNNTCLSLPLPFLLFHFVGPLLDLALFPLPIFPSYQFLPHSSSPSFLSLSSFSNLHSSFSPVII